MGKKANGTVFLCGAGISVPPPANLPSVNYFKSELAKAIGGNLDIQDDIIRRCLYGDEIYRGLRFEQIITCLSEIDPALESLNFARVRSNHGSRFNGLHAYLAERAVLGDTVLTTNFDTLIEQAMLFLWPERVHASISNIVKLHGTAHKIYDGELVAEHPSNLRADIASVARGGDTAHAPSDILRSVSSANGGRLVVMGYSFSDSFDITPALREIRPKIVDIYDYCGHAPRKVEFEESNFLHISDIIEIWQDAGAEVSVFQGDVSAKFWHSSVSKVSTLVQSQSDELYIPKFSRDELMYFVARLSFNLDDRVSAGSIFEKLILSNDRRLRERANFFYVRCLPMSSKSIDASLEAAIAMNDLKAMLDTLVFAMDIATYSGRQSDFRKILREVRAKVRNSGEIDYVGLVEGRSLHCIANYFFYSGRFGLAQIAMRAALKKRSRFAEPIETLYSTFGVAILDILSRPHESNAMSFEQFSRYAAEIGDSAAAACVLVLDAMQNLKAGNYQSAESLLRDALSLDSGDFPKWEIELYIFLSLSMSGRCAYLTDQQVVKVGKALEEMHHSRLSAIKSDIMLICEGGDATNLQDPFVRAIYLSLKVE